MKIELPCRRELNSEGCKSALEGQLEDKLEFILAVRRPSWSSEGHLGVQIGLDSAASADCTGPSGVQEARKGCTDGCAEANSASKRTGWAAQTGVQGTSWRPAVPSTESPAQHIV